MGETEAIRCENLSKHFGKSVALEGLSLAVERGSAFGFLGPNGAGKTTTLRMFTGLTNPTTGSMWVAGETYRAAPSGCAPGLATCPSPGFLRLDDWPSVPSLYRAAVRPRL